MSVYHWAIDGWHLVRASPAPTSKLFKCKTCHKTFHTKTARRKHSKSHTAAFKCELETCHRSFRSQDAANQHMKALKHWAPRYKCQTCSRTFPSQTAAEQHMTEKRHQTPPPKVVLPAEPRIPSQPEASVPNVADKLVSTFQVPPRSPISCLQLLFQHQLTCQSREILVS
jgi:DNA-directed RNA polymerase subunit RPC12/RpoP